MLVERNVPLQAHNTFGISAKALQLVRVQSESDIGALLADPQLRDTQKFVLGGGSNIVLTGDLKALVLKVELKGMRLVEESEKAWVVEAAAGEDWHDFVQWTLDNSWPGLENMALIPGSVGASPVQNKMAETGIRQPTAQQIFEWVCAIRRAKLPDPAVIGNAGSFFKNPTVTPEQCADIIARDPKVVHYLLDDGRIKLAAGWLIDACGWKGKSVGNAAVYEKQALVLVNKGGRENPCTGGEVMTLAKAIQTSVYERFGILLEPEPVVV